ncbi:MULTISPECIES: heavy metal translocating P-type ATPase [Acidaminococcus]|uniref:heavy metal translocating P-type ATPase n=1 Tax=Acidaminococcus TaxID=904 RepID=UPI0003ADAE17|nr:MULTISPECIES: heavy metal translocating P-type ATPase [Acidaminococcus]ERL16026.1 heavy metal translocating P-type ATPase [Acidaminococcus sp. BV3L6]
MKFQMIHEVRDRIHVRCLSAKGVLFRGFDARQGAVILSRLERISGVYKVKLYSASGEVAITFAPDKRASLRPILLDTLAYLDPNDPGLQKSSKHQADALILNRTYRNRLISHVTRHFACKWFLPMPVRMLRAWYHTLGFIRKGVKSLLSGKLDVPVLDATAITAAMLQNDLGTAGSIMLLLGIGDILEEWTLKKSVHDLASHMSINVDTAWKVLENGTEIEVPLTEVEKGDVISVKMGSTIPLDGLVTGGEALVNQASMTGESMPVRKTVDGTVFAGTVVEDGEICIRVTGTVGDTRFDRIVKMIEDSEAFKSNLEGRANHLADRLVPWCLGGTLLTYLITRNVMKAMAVLMVDFSCALKLSMPLAVLSAMRECSTYKITVKGGKFLEAVAEADTIVFDKTGTLTLAKPKVADVICFDGYSRETVLRYAACLEEHFPHSVANAIVRQAADEGITHDELHSKVEYIVAHGIASRVGDKRIVIGSHHFIFEDEHCRVPEGQEDLFESRSPAYSHVFMALNGVLMAIICISDPLRPEAVEVMKALRRVGFQNLVMMTGDSKRTAENVAATLELDRFYAEVLPEEKAQFVKAAKAEGHRVVMVGDGINDSPALSEADAGIAIAEGADIAREIADITISARDLHQLIVLKELSNLLMKRVNFNYDFVVSFNAALIALGVAGILPPATTALLHNGSTIALSLHSMTNLKKFV